MVSLESPVDVGGDPLHLVGGVVLNNLLQLRQIPLVQRLLQFV